MDRTLDIVLRARDEASATLKRFSNTLTGDFEQATDASRKFAVGLAGVAAGAAGFIGYGAKIAGDLESSRQGFITLLGSAEEADKILNQIKKDAASTPFELPGLIQANQLLTAVTKNGQQSETLLLNVGKALAAMGKGQGELDRIIVNLQQIGAVGKASMLDIKQFAFAGIPIFEMLQQATGKTGEALSDMISSGGVTFEMLEEMFNKAGSAGGRFADAFKNQAGTFNQLMSNMKDSFNIFMSDVIQQTGVFDMLKDGIERLINFMNDHKEDIINFIKGAFEFIKNNAPIIAGIIIGGLVPAILAFAASVATATLALAPYLIAGAAVGLLAKLIMDNWGTIAPFFQGIWAAISPFFDWLGSIVRPIIEGLTPLFEQIRQSLAYTGEIIQTQLVPAWNQLMEALRPFIDALSPIIVEMLKNLAIGFLILVGAILALAAAVLTGLLTAFATALPFVAQALEGLILFIRGFIQIVTGLFTGDLGMVIEGVKNMFSGAASFIINALQSVYNFISGFVKGVIAFFMSLYNALVGHSIIPDLVNGIIMFFGRLRDTVTSIVTNLVNNIAGLFMGLISKAFDWGRSIISNMINGIKSAIQGAGKLAGKLLEGIGISMGELMSFDSGGYVPKTGLAMVHKGEYVLSNDMLAGRQAIDAPVTNNNMPINITAYVSDSGDIETLSQKLAFYLKTSGSV